MVKQQPAAAPDGGQRGSGGKFGSLPAANPPILPAGRNQAGRAAAMGGDDTGQGSGGSRSRGQSTGVSWSRSEGEARTVSASETLSRLRSVSGGSAAGTGDKTAADGRAGTGATTTTSHSLSVTVGGLAAEGEQAATGLPADVQQALIGELHRLTGAAAAGIAVGGVLLAGEEVMIALRLPRDSLAAAGRAALAAVFPAAG